MNIETPNSPQERTKCDASGCCKHLGSRLGDGGKGFKYEQTIQDDPDAPMLEAKFFGVSYRTSAKDRGLMVNWCPFCGGQPGPWKRNQ